MAAAALAELAFLQPLTAAERDRLAVCAEPRRFAAGAYLLRRGDPAQWLYLLRSGQVLLEGYLPEYGAVPVETLHAGDPLGWSWLLPPYQWHFDAQAQGAVETVAFDTDCLRRQMGQDPALGYRLQQCILRVVLQRLQSTRLQLLDVYGQPGREAPWRC